MSEKKKNTKLSSQMIIFCDELAKGKSQADAYLFAYPKTKSRESARANAARLIAIDSVFDYYQSLLKQNAESSKVTRDEILSKYKEIYNSSPDGLIIKNSDRLKALELTAKMLGFNEPDKIDMTSKGESIKPETPYQIVISGVIKDA